jgi:hypothetical protein
MHPLPRIVLLSLVAGSALALAALAQSGDPKTGDPKKISLDKFKMPPGGVVVLVDEKQDVRGYFPRMVILTPEKHQELMDRIAALEKQVKGERKTPYQCRMTATVEGDTVRLVADLSFQTDQPRSSVFVGFLRTQLAEARIRPRDGDAAWQPAVLTLASDGYSVSVDKAGDYQLSLEARLPLGSGPGGPGPGAERSLELALPGAAVTTLALDLLAPVKEVRWNKTNIDKPLAAGSEQKHWELAVGNVTQLQVTWKEPLDGGNPAPLRMVRGQVIVRVEDQVVLTTAELTLTDVRGKAKDWRLWLPPKAEVKVLAPEGLAHKWTKPNANSQHLTLNQPTTDPIKIQVTVALPRALGKIPVGPFAVQDAQRQEGTIEVKLPVEARRGVRLAYHLAGSLEERELPRDAPGSETVAVFKYWDMPVPPKGATPAVIAKTLVPPLEVELKTIQGKVETRCDHQLSLRPAENGWQITATCKIVARPLDAPVDFLDVQLPRIPGEAFPLMMEPSLGGFPAGIPWSAWATAGQVPLDSEWVLAGGSPAVDIVPVEGTTKLQRRVRLKWSQPQPKEFSVTLVGTYNLPAGAQRVRLELPQPLNAFHDSGATTKIDVPDTLELLVSEGGPELPLSGKHTATRTWDRAPASWDLAWRPYRAEFAVSVVADVAFRPRYAHVKEQLTWDQTDRAANKSPFLLLKVPPDVRNLKVASGGKLRSLDAGKQLAFVDLPAEAAGKTTIVVEYDFALPQAAAAKQDIVTPLIWPEQATQADAKVRLWGPPGTDPILVSAGLPQLAWNDVGLEVVPGRSDLPIRVLQSEGPLATLTLRLAAVPATLAGVVVDRALIQVSVDEDGTEQYRARFLLAKLNAPSLDVRLPIALKGLDPRFTLDGKEIVWRPKDQTGLVARLDVDLGLYSRPVLLEIAYQLPRGQPTPEGLWHTTLHPPVLEGQVILGKVLWQVTLPPNSLAVSARGEATTEQRWGWQGGLPALGPALSSAELEQWITGQEGPDAAGEASLLSAASSLEPLRIFRVSRALWFLLCSGIVLLPGLALYARPPRPLGWLLLLMLALACLGSTGWFWPELLPAVLLGALPGLALLAVLLTLQWMVHERYRRQLVFMPGFTRVKAGSSLIRPSSVNRQREPSTVDVPPPDELKS